ncbi:3',5'-cyclic adenosine monophosphate phosphodiesterase CpdA [Sideroxyarcus emersonii]|uniref:3',5'-cyclic adenosine monophosphate phosphodiesterase CpdA n=1 Tax=Sideroxyarcus emersonii TaxID=2764705 RepID=A0AAN1XC90_9PROT|nr:metallophosphoesterase [Sideroxyarcus emersonii]BCK88529.1 3',5'-cyclic adenosine monophosphate phosphodiesterase CpdA [Sideroxyarcus emersonii]
MLGFLIVAFFIYGSMHLYAFAKLWQVLPHSWWLGLSLLAVGLLLTFLPLLLWQITRLNWHGAAALTSWVSYVWMGYLFLFCSTALLFDIAHVLAVFAGMRWPLGDAASLLAVGLLSLALLGYGSFEARHIRIAQVIVTTSKLPATVGHVTIAQISDLHLGAMLNDEFLDRVIAGLREAKPDIVVATGDIVDGQGDHLDALASRLHALQPPMGAYAVIGNHETHVGLDRSLDFLRSAGFTVLRGEAAHVGGIVLVGVDDPSAAMTGQGVRLDTAHLLATVPKGSFVVLLKHQPVVDNGIPFDLQLSGHIHGGQIFPFGLLTQLTYHVHTGLTQLAGGSKLYVSRGTGTWGPPIRLFAPPEIALIRIERE